MVPHVHVNISHEIDISINFLTGEILAGKIPPKYKKEIMDKIFNDDNQKELAQYYNKLSLKNAKLMLSNSNPKNVNENDNFFEDIYKGFYINEVSAKRMINSNTKGRGEISELLITNYKEQLKWNYQIDSTLERVALS